MFGDEEDSSTDIITGSAPIDKVEIIYVQN